MLREAAATPLIPRRYWLIALALAVAAAAILLWMGRPLICTCGEVKLWVGEVHGPDNSQHIADWYTPSHIIHGFLFYWLGWLFLRRNPPGDRLIGAILIEGAWEILENSQWVIDRYREATIALGYSGDSILNSASDVTMMALGFLAARRLPVWISIVALLVLELVPLIVIRDNLTLNIIMLVAPSDAILNWQAG